MNTFKVNVFGVLELIDPAGKRIAVPGGKQQALLAYLAVNSGHPVPRDRLMGLFWSDRFNDQARQSLRQGISKLKKLLTHNERSGIWADNDNVGLDTDMVDVDALQFSNLIKDNEGNADERALDLFRGPLLDGLFGSEAGLEDWLTTERERFNGLATPVFQRLSNRYLKTGNRENALEIARRLIALDPLREGAHRLVMRILAQSGQRAAAIQQYKTCEDLLMRELDVSPDPETLRLLEEIKSPGKLAPEGMTITAKRTDAVTSNHAEKKTSQKVSITVLPFQAAGDAEALPLFASGLSEDVTTGLTKYRWLDVMVYKQTAQSELTVADRRGAMYERGVLYSVEGSVRQLGDRFRITAQLVDLASGKYAWVERYDRVGDDLFALQDQMAETIAASVETELVSFEGEKARTLSEDNMSAWDCYHLGLATQYEFSPEGNARAQSLFKRAIELDPSFGMAFARLSYAMVLSTIYFEADQQSGILENALDYAKKATRLDDQDAVARFALGRTYLALGEYKRSVFELNRSIELNPSLAQAHCGLGDSLAYMGEAEAAIPCFEEAVRLSPHDPHRWAFSMYGSIASIFSQDYERAVEWAINAVSVPNSHYWANAAMVSALGHLGDDSNTKPAVEDLLNLKPDFDCAFARDRLFFLRDKSQVDCYIDGLKKAGIP